MSKEILHVTFYEAEQSSTEHIDLQGAYMIMIEHIALMS